MSPLQLRSFPAAAPGSSRLHWFFGKPVNLTPLRLDPCTGASIPAAADVSAHCASSFVPTSAGFLRSCLLQCERKALRGVRATDVACVRSGRVRTA